jgi:hypothetical protein
VQERQQPLLYYAKWDIFGMLWCHLHIVIFSDHFVP